MFLFFDAELFDRYRAVGASASTIGFVDDTNLLAYGSTTEGNCTILGKLHDVYMQWARSHGATFEPSKYELIHLAKKPHRLNMEAVFKVADCEVPPSVDIRVLGV